MPPRLDGLTSRGGSFVERFFAPSFLKRYLAAKRQVEAALKDAASAGALQTTVLRPSLVYDTSNKGMLGFAPLWGAFYALNVIGVPFVDRPTSVGTLAAAAVEMATASTETNGPPYEAKFLRYAQMDEAAQRGDRRYHASEERTATEGHTQVERA